MKLQYAGIFKIVDRADEARGAERGPIGHDLQRALGQATQNDSGPEHAHKIETGGPHAVDPPWLAGVGREQRRIADADSGLGADASYPGSAATMAEVQVRCKVRFLQVEAHYEAPVGA